MNYTEISLCDEIFSTSSISEARFLAIKNNPHKQASNIFFTY